MALHGLVADVRYVIGPEELATLLERAGYSHEAQTKLSVWLIAFLAIPRPEGEQWGMALAIIRAMDVGRPSATAFVAGFIRQVYEKALACGERSAAELEVLRRRAYPGNAPRENHVYTSPAL